MTEKQKKKSRNTGPLLTGIAIVFLLIGITLILNKPITGWVVDHMTSDAIDNRAGENYEQSVAKAKEADDVSFDFEEVVDISLGQVLKAQMDKQKPDSIGIISVPNVNMELPILYGVSNRNLAIGAGTMKENMKMGKGNYALAGHNVRNEKSLFSPLTLADVGMLIYVTDYSKVYVYEIDHIHVVEPTAVEVIDDHEGQKELTLVTCSFEGKKRQITHAKFVRAMNIEDAPKDAFQTATKK